MSYPMRANNNNNLCMGTFTFLYPKRKISRNGDSYTAFQINDGNQIINAYAWDGQFRGLKNLEHGQVIHLTGKWVPFNDQHIVQCRTIAPSEAEPTAVKQARFRIRAIMAWMQTDVLKEFVCRVFGDPELLEHFVSLPASQYHHHGYPQGLFIHSVDAAWRIFENPALQGEEKDLATVAALLHDIGKTKTFTKDKQRTVMGKLNRHEVLTLEVLSDALDWLDEEDVVLGAKLRHYLTWDPKKDPIPRLIGAELVKFVDHVSVANEISRSGLEK